MQRPKDAAEERARDLSWIGLLRTRSSFRERRWRSQAAILEGPGG